MKKNIEKLVVSDFYESVILNLKNNREDEFNEGLIIEVSHWLKTLNDETDVLEANVKSIMSSTDLSKEEKRICILLSSLKHGKGLTEVTTILQTCGMRELYVRNLFEFVLHYCFSANEKGNRYTVGEFNKLYSKCAKLIDASFKANRTTFEKNDKAPTLRELDQLVAKNTTLSNDNMMYLTNNVTENVLSALKKVECIESSTDDIVVRLAEAFSEKFVDGCEITRYYFAKYLAYIVKSQIKEFKEILLDFTTMTIQEAYEKYSNLNIGNVISLRETFSYSINKLHGFTKAKEPTQLKKDILQQLIDSFVLYGSNPYKKSKLMTTLAQFKDNIRVFKNEDEEIAQLRENVAKLSLEDFYDYKINMNELYNIIFERVISVDYENDWRGIDESLADEFMKGVLKGQCDLSRSAFMFFLSNASQILRASNMYDCDESNDLGISFRYEDILNKRRFEKIIPRCHFAPVGAYATDALYYTNLEMPSEYFEQWRAVVEDSDSFASIPHEIEYISGAGIRKVKSKYKGVI